MSKLEKFTRPRWLNTIRQQLIFFCLAIVIVPYCVVCFAVYNAYVDSMRVSAEQYIMQYGEQIASNLDVYFAQINELTLRPYYDSTLMKALRARADAADAGELQDMPQESISTMQFFLVSVGFSRREFDSVSLITADGYELSNVDGQMENSVLPVEILQYTRYMTPHGFYYLPPHSIERNNAPRVVTSVIRELREGPERRVLGYIRIDISQRMLRNMISDTTNKYDNLLYVANRHGDVLYPTRQQMSTLPFQPARKVKLNDVEYSLYINASPGTMVFVYQLASESTMLASAGELLRFTLAVALIVATLAILAIVGYSYGMTRPLHDLAGHMLKVQDGDFTAKIPFVRARQDEIGRLMEGFNSMVERIRTLIVENLQTTLLKREAEYKALQRQIDPHFLYNTLELINMLALERHEYQISDTVSSLGRMLRYTVSNDRAMCALKEELSFLEAYFHILKIRNGERLNWEIEYDPELGEIEVPRLILQPLAENAFIHGLKAERGFIAVRVEDAGDHILIEVEDDGTGLSKEALANLRRTIDAREGGEAEGGHALENVNRRLFLIYGEAYQMRVESSSDKGTRFTLLLPRGEETRLPIYGRYEDEKH